MVPCRPAPTRIHRSWHGLRALLLVPAAAATVACASTPSTGALAAGREAVVTGRVTAVDRDPWAYDGDGLLVLATDTHGTVTVHVPARINLCRAQGLDLFTTATIGQRIVAAGTATGATDLSVCLEPTHHLRVVAE